MYISWINLTVIVKNTKPFPLKWIKCIIKSSCAAQNTYQSLRCKRMYTFWWNRSTTQIQGIYFLLYIQFTSIFWWNAERVRRFFDISLMLPYNCQILNPIRIIEFSHPKWIDSSTHTHTHAPHWWMDKSDLKTSPFYDI